MVVIVVVALFILLILLQWLLVNGKLWVVSMFYFAVLVVAYIKAVAFLSW